MNELRALATAHDGRLVTIVLDTGDADTEWPTLSPDVLAMFRKVYVVNATGKIVRVHKDNLGSIA